MKIFVLLLIAVLLQAMPVHSLLASENPPPVIDQIVVEGSRKNLRVTPAPGVQAYQFYSAPSVAGPFSVNTNFILTPYITGYSTNSTTNGPVTITNYAYEWRNTNFAGNSGFFTMSATPLLSNTVALATVLNRLAYGPTPDDLTAYANNPQAYIDEQLNMNGIPETLDTYTVEITNAIPSDPLTNWTRISMTGTLASVNFYLFTTAPGDIYLDDFELNPYIYTNYLVTNIVNVANTVVVTNKAFSHIETTNMLVNGDFDGGAMPPWTTSGGAVGSVVQAGVGRLGSAGLHVISTTGASSTTAGYVRQIISTAGFATTNPCVLKYWYLPSTNSNKLRVQIGSGINSTPGGIPTTPTWVYATATGKVGSTSRIYFYMSGPGTCYLDDIKLVLGTVPESGANLIANGGFETGSTNSWSFSNGYLTNSVVVGDVAHSGNYSLKLVGTANGSTSVSLFQNPALVNGQTYSVSFWYRPTTMGVTMTGELNSTGLTSGTQLKATPDITVGGNYRRLLNAGAGLSDYRAWFCSHAVNSKRQLFEILSQFWENHFVTQHTKGRDYIDNFGYGGTEAGILATDWEWREMSKWRNAMLNPNCTFYDMLRISAESPAQIVYLDTVNSKGNGNNIANENYARELLELYAFGVDNGYDQNDIVVISRAWTGWSVELVDKANANNPFAAASVTFYPGANTTSKTNIIGTWAFNFKPANYGTNRGPIFASKTVPARFGPPWAGASYQLTLPPRAALSTNAIQDGYDVIAHMANQPFTQEYISVKLCRMFVHDEFPNPTTLTDSPDYYFYDYTDPNRSAEAELVHQCMLAWENSSPKGNLRAVLSVIFNSDLFRSQTANAQKVKTPFEFVTSAVRALRASTNGGSGITSTTDGYSVATPLSRMGGMNLFDRDAPDGYPENGANWVSAGTLVERIRFIQTFLNAGTGDDAGNHQCDPVGLLKANLPSLSWGNAGDVTDYLLGILYPAEGAANLKLYGDAGVAFLNTGNDGIASSPFTSGLSDYDTRVRGLVSMLMTLQRFQEQ